MCIRDRIIVENSVKFLQDLAKYHLHKFDLKTIGITGSNGKTIVKEWLYQSLFDEFITVKSPKSFNSQIGLPISLLGINNKPVSYTHLDVYKRQHLILQLQN